MRKNMTSGVLSNTKFLGGLLLLAMAGFHVNSAVAEKHSGIEKRGIDPSVRAQDNLFLYVNGEWIKHTPIPEDRSNYGTFLILDDESKINIHAIIEETLTGDFPPGSIEQQIADFFRSYMDEERIEELGIEPLRDELARIDRLTTHAELIEHLGYLRTIGVGGPIAFYVGQDAKDSSRYLATITQSGTSLPDRDYYLTDDEDHAAAREAFKKYVNTLFELSELPHEENVGEQICELETELARVHWTRTELRDADKRYNLHRLEELVERVPEVDWSTFFTAAGVDGVAELNVATPSYFEELNTFISSVPLETWKQYLRFNLIDSFASALPRDFVDAQFALYSKQLADVPEQKPRWKRAVEALSGGRGFGVLGDGVGQMYVERHFPSEAKARMEELVENLLQAFENSIDELTWMTPATKQRAHEKLSKINTKIGYTDKWRDYSGLEIRPDDLVGNLLRSRQLEYRRMIDKLGKPVDAHEWHMTPQTVNAYYSASKNEIVFPAAILQPPFFDVTADDAVNYGAIGAIIGHEISHAFDDQGSKYDGDGNLNNWWTDEDRAAFHQLSAKLVEQFSAFSPLPGKYINGQLTLGENIADLSGMSVAYKAYRNTLGDKEAPVIDGWSGDQRFFLGWGQSWRRKYRDAALASRLLTDPHSPGMYRSNGPLSNFNPFYAAFDVQVGDEMYRPPEERIRIW